MNDLKGMRRLIYDKVPYHLAIALLVVYDPLEWLVIHTLVAIVLGFFPALGFCLSHLLAVKHEFVGAEYWTIVALGFAVGCGVFWLIGKFVFNYVDLKDKLPRRDK